MLKIFLLFSFFISNLLFANFLKSSDDKLFKSQGVELSILNKLTTKNYLLISPLNQEISIGNRKLIIYNCIYKDKKKSFSQLALIKFFSDNLDSYNFIGWLFNDSPSLSELEDAVFDLRLNKCLDDDPIFPKLDEIN